MIQTYAINKEGKKELNISLQAANIEQYQWLWVDITEPTETEMKVLSDVFMFHPLAIEDCINHTIQRPKLDYYRDLTFFITHALNRQTFDKAEVSIFLGENYLVTFHYKDLSELNDVWNKLISSTNIEEWDHYYVFYQVFDKMVDNYFPILYSLEDQLNSLDENRNGWAMGKQLEELFEIKSNLITIRHTIHPMRDLLYRMVNSHHLEGVRERKEYFSDIYDHLLKLSEMVDSNREMTNDLRDSYLSLTTHQQNKIMQVLTVITTIFMPLTFIAGVYGMNFENMPELKWRYGYFITLSLMTLIGLSMFYFFKKKGWFK
ncbi:magnesium/cobalt transporter CorA [Bacillus salitolerans]|uniref:Magnesium transport protein CorA n=1 Tax=Bacillus salitolerans TaxID=1437434 RepID=A0ABW4LQ13_9BACI